jgi:hypothetical protein
MNMTMITASCPVFASHWLRDRGPDQRDAVRDEGHRGQRVSDDGKMQGLHFPRDLAIF